jgi:uncharacterized Zn finger protein (UPF0148 family)
LSEATAERRKVVSTAELMRRGATLLNETCPRCGSVQIRYQGKVYCINEDDLSAILSSPDPVSRTPAPVLEPRMSQGKDPNPAPSRSSAGETSERDALQTLLEEKLAKVSKELENSQDFAQQEKLLDLISKYLETLGKLKGNQSVH